MNKYLGVKLIEAEPQLRGYSFGITKPNDAISESTFNEEGYKVVNEYGKDSWIAKKAFEKAYRKIDNLTFGLAIEALKQGKKVVRKGFNGKGMYVGLQVPDEQSKMTRPYFCMYCPKGSTKHFGEQEKELEIVPWLPSATDILAEDWYIVE